MVQELDISIDDINEMARMDRVLRDGSFKFRVGKADLSIWQNVSDCDQYFAIRCLALLLVVQVRSNRILLFIAVGVHLCMTSLVDSNGAIKH